MLSAIIDIIALTLIGFFAFWGYKKGFVKTFIATFSIFFSLLFAVLLSGVTAKFMESQFSMTSKMASGLQGTLTRVFGDKLMNTTLEQAGSSNLSGAGLSGLIVKMVLSLKYDVSTLPPDTTLNKIVAPTFAYYITVLISALLLFALFRVAFFLLGETFLKEAKNNTIKKMDKELGLIFGVFRAILIMQIVILVVDILPFGFFNSFSVAIKKAPITGLISKINIFGLITSAISDTKYIVSLIL